MANTAITDLKTIDNNKLSNDDLLIITNDDDKLTYNIKLQDLYTWILNKIKNEENLTITGSWTFEKTIEGTARDAFYADKDK